MFLIDKYPFTAFNKDAQCKAKYRDGIDILSHILEVANGGIATKTKIMYRANISHAQLEEYMMFLMENDLLCYGSSTSTFKTTQKGLRFLEAYHQMYAMVKA